MYSDLSKLLELQAIDLQLLEIEKALGLVPEQKKNLHARIAALRDNIKTAEENHKKKQVLQKSLELDIEKIKEQIQKMNMTLNTVKKNEEYTRILGEIDKQKSGIAAIEEKIIVMMESAEADYANLKTQKESLENEIRDCESQVKQVDLEDKNNQSLKQQKLLERKALAETLEGELFSRYQRYFEKKKTIILVPLDAHDHCGGCHQLVTVYLKNEIRKKGLESCDQCGRLIYMPVPDEKDSSIPEP